MKFKADVCGYCGACVSVCPQNILEIAEWQIIIKQGCEECGRCSIVCPLGAISHEKNPVKEDGSNV